MKKDQVKKTFKLAIWIYLASFLIINWSDVSWIFNYREVSGLISDFFNPYPSIDASTMGAYIYPNTNQTNTAAGQIIKEVKINYTDKLNSIEIPKISIVAPIVFPNNANKSLIEDNLDLGVVYYPGSVYPGQVGQIVILGHSAPPGWPKIKHDWVFTDIDELILGDIILINLNNKQYTYIVRQKSIIQRGAEVQVSGLNLNNNNLTLISCWPPGKNYQRIVVQAELENG